MQRLSLRLGAAALAAPARSRAPLAFSARRTYRTTTALLAEKSSPSEAEAASAASGGSRSKDASVAKGVADSAARAAASEGGETQQGSSQDDPPSVPDALAQGGAKGRTGGGEPLESSEHAPPQPKISNASVPGKGAKLTKEQQEEVDAHNRDFEEKHDRAESAAGDKVDKSFWSGGGTKQGKE